MDFEVDIVTSIKKQLLYPYIKKVLAISLNHKNGLLNDIEHILSGGFFLQNRAIKTYI